MAAHLLRRRTAKRALALRPLHNAGDADHKRLGHRAAGLTRSRRRNHPLPQVQRIGSRRSLLASNPASSLNLTRAPWNPPEFSQTRSRSRSLDDQAERRTWFLFEATKLAESKLGIKFGERGGRETLHTKELFKMRRFLLAALAAASLCTSASAAGKPKTLEELFAPLSKARASRSTLCALSG